MRWPCRVKILVPGKIKFPFIKEGALFYAQRLKRYLPFSLEEKKVPRSKDPSKLKRLEAEALIKGVSPESFIVALDVKGQELDSQKFSQKLGKLLEARQEIVFLIGGAYGLEEDLLKKANWCLSLSRLTFNHEIALLILLEQLYRALSILAGEPYHK